MTDLRASQLATVAVEGGTAQLDASQLSTITLLANPAAAGLRVSELFIITVIAYGSTYMPLGPVIGLNCWTPCGVLMWNGS